MISKHGFRLCSSTDVKYKYVVSSCVISLSLATLILVTRAFAIFNRKHFLSPVENYEQRQRNRRTKKEQMYGCGHVRSVSLGSMANTGKSLSKENAGGCSSSPEGKWVRSARTMYSLRLT